jgi:MFS family permease
MLTRVLRNRDFAIYLAGNTCSLHGTWIQRVASGWLAWELSHSAFWVGLVALATFLPLLILGPVFGVLADQFDRKRAAIAVNAAQICFAGALFAVTLAGWMSIELLCVLSLLVGAAQSAYQPIRMLLVNEIVQREDLARAVAINATAFNVSRFLGPALAGIIIARTDVAFAFAVNALSFVALMLALSLIRLRTSKVRRSASSILADLSSGIRYAMAHSTIREQLLITASTSLFGRGVLELLPVFADQVFKRGSNGLAMLTSSAGAGAIVASVLLSRWAGTETLRVLTVVGSVGTGALLLVLGASEIYVIGIVTVAALAFTLTLTGIGSQALLQSQVTDEFRGRIVSLWGIVALAAPAIGAVGIGAVSHFFGMQATTLAMGAISLLSSIVMTLRLRAQARQGERASHDATA